VALQKALDMVESDRQRLARKALNTTIFSGLAVAGFWLVLVFWFLREFPQAFFFPAFRGACRGGFYVFVQGAGVSQLF
jgi:hypothetical protein